MIASRWIGHRLAVFLAEALSWRGLNMRRPRLQIERLERRMVPSSSVELISTGAAGTPSAAAGGGLEDTGRLISDDGRYTLLGGISNVMANQPGGIGGYLLYDRVAATHQLVTHKASSPTSFATGYFDKGAITSDGRFVLFQSNSEDLVPGLTFSGITGYQLYTFDRTTGAVSLISHAAGFPTVASNDVVQQSTISNDGRWIAFTSAATNLIDGFIPGSTLNAFTNVYLHDRFTGATSLASHQSGLPTKGTERASTNPLLSNDGARMVFHSESSKLIPGFTGVIGNAFSYDRTTDSSTLLTTPGSGPTNQGVGAFAWSMTPDGRYLTIGSKANDYIAGFVDGNGTANSDLYRHDLLTGERLLVTHAVGQPLAGSNGGLITNPWNKPIVSGNGQAIAFVSVSSDLVSNFVDENGVDGDLFVWNVLAEKVTLVSHSTAGPNHTGQKGTSQFGFTQFTLSGDGQRIVFLSGANDLVSGFVDGNIDVTQNKFNVYFQDLATGQTQLINHAMGDSMRSSDGPAGNPTISSDGQWIAFDSSASNIAANDFNSIKDAFLLNVSSGETVLMTERKGIASTTPGGASNQHQVSRDGRYVVYASSAANIVAGQIDYNIEPDIFLYDRKTGETTLVSQAFGTLTQSANSGSGVPTISGDGRFVAYTSKASDLIPNFVDRNGPGSNYIGTDVFLYDRLTGQNTLVSHRYDSVSDSGDRGSGGYADFGTWVSISFDGRYLVYRSQASDIVAGFVDTNLWDSQANFLCDDLYVYDRTTNQNSLVNRQSGSTNIGSNKGATYAVISGDGQSITYASQSSNLVAGYVGGTAYNIYLFDVATGGNQLVSHAAENITTSGNGSVWKNSEISFDGRFVAYSSAATNLVAGMSDPGSFLDVFLWDRLADTTSLVSHSVFDSLTVANGTSLFGSVQRLAISDDGGRVVYQSAATNLVNGFVHNNAAEDGDIFVYDRATNTNRLASRAWNGVNSSGDKRSEAPIISGDGRFVAFSSASTNLIEGYTLGSSSGAAFIYDYATDSVRLATPSMTDPLRSSNGGSFRISLNENGSVLTVSGDGSDMVPNDYNYFDDVFAYVTPPPRVTSVQINDGSAQRSIIRSMTITFDDYVFVDSSPLSVVSGQGQAVVGVQWAVNYVNNSTVMTVTFSGANTEFGSLADGNYVLSLNASKISGVGQLDGNGDGVGGDNYTFTFHRLFGDGNGDRKVNATDFASFIGAYSQPGFAFDFNNDGVVTASDFNAFRLRYGVTI